jgi:hypothetical protein
MGPGPRRDDGKSAIAVRTKWEMHLRPPVQHQLDYSLLRRDDGRSDSEGTGLSVITQLCPFHPDLTPSAEELSRPQRQGAETAEQGADPWEQATRPRCLMMVGGSARDS